MREQDLCNPWQITGSVVGDGWGRCARNPTLFDLALPGTSLHPIFLYHNLPSQVTLANNGGTVPLGGDVQLYALQFEIALNERLSIVATKDGYVDMNYDNTFQDQVWIWLPSSG